MIKKYESLYECDCGGEEIHGLIWSPELTGHNNWHLPITSITGFETQMLKPGDVFCIEQNAGKNVFKVDSQDFFITDELCKVLIKNSIEAGKLGIDVMVDDE